MVVPNCKQIWTKELHDGYAVTFLNFTRSKPLASSTPPPGRASPGSSGGRAVPSGATAAGGGIGNGLTLAACDATDPTQQWTITTKGGGGGDPAMSVVQSAAGNKACWELNGCNYDRGTKVDTAYGCKPLPPRGLVDPCCSNMAFSFNQNGTITTSYGGMCFAVGGLAPCNGSAVQQWSLGALSANNTQQIIQQKVRASSSPSSGGGAAAAAAGARGKQYCVGRTTSAADAADGTFSEDAAAAGAGALSGAGAGADGAGGAGGLQFDVKKELGWDSANVRDLWAHKDLGNMKVIAVRLQGDGDAAMYKLTKGK